MGFGSRAFGGGSFGGLGGSPLIGNSSLTSWNLSYKLNRFQNCSPQANRPTYGTLKLQLITTGGLHYLAAIASGNVVFSGSRVGDGLVNIYDTSGNLLGTVNLTYAGDFYNGLYIQSYPAKYLIYYSQDINWSYTVTGASWAASVATVTIGAHNVQVGEQITISGVNPSGYNGTFTVTAITGTAVKFALNSNPGSYVAGGLVIRPAKATIFDDGRSGSYSFYSPPNLTAGTWYILVHQVDEDGNESTGTTLISQSIVHIPTAPAVPTYTSGNFSNTAISWPAITGGDAAATYNGYDSADTGILNPVIAFTHASGSGTLTSTLPAISSTFTGTRYVLLRSLLGGVESTNSVVLQIQYVNGTVTSVRPNAPLVTTVATSGRTLTIGFSLDTFQAPIQATFVRLFASQDPNSFNYGSPIASTALSAPTSRIQFGSVAGAVASDGPWYFQILTDSVNGLSQNPLTFGPVQLSTAVPSDPTVTVSGSV